MATTGVSYVQSVSDIGALVYENFKGKVKPWLDVIDAMAALFGQLGPGEYSLQGEKLVFAADDKYAGMAMATNGYLPGSQHATNITLETTPARMYVRRIVDNFTVARASGEATFENFMTRIMRQMWEAFERATIRHIHGSSTATVCTVHTRTSGTVFVVQNGYGYTGATPGLFLEPGMWLALLDVSVSYTVLGVARITGIDHTTSASTATITFLSTIDNGAAAVAGDVFVFCTSTDSTDDWFVTERSNAPLGLLDLLDPSNANTSYLGVTESSSPRIEPIRRASSDWGEFEFMEWIAEIEAKSNSEVSPSSHVFTLHPGVLLELAKTLIPYTQIMGKGQELTGGWTTVQIGGHDFVKTGYHVQDVVYAICKEDAHVVDLDGEASIWDGDGSQFRRLANYDGKEWFAKHYGQRFFSRRNRSGCLTSVTNPNYQKYSTIPSSS